jgi:hypothetical protein
MVPSGDTEYDAKYLFANPRPRNRGLRNTRRSIQICSGKVDIFPN